MRRDPVDALRSGSTHGVNIPTSSASNIKLESSDQDAVRSSPGGHHRMGRISTVNPIDTQGVDNDALSFRKKPDEQRTEPIRSMLPIARTIDGSEMAVNFAGKPA